MEKQWSRRLLFCILQGREIQTQNPAVYHLVPSTYLLLSTIYYLSPIFLFQEMPCHLQSQPENVFISYLHIIVFIDIEL